MSERQYLLQHMLFLSSKLSKTTTLKERKNIQDALLFYAKELRKLEAKNHLYYS